MTFLIILKGVRGEDKGKEMRPGKRKQEVIRKEERRGGYEREKERSLGKRKEEMRT